MNRIEYACREWAKGCSCAPEGRPWECEACTQGLLDAIQHFAAEDEAGIAPSKTGCIVRAIMEADAGMKAHEW